MNNHRQEIWKMSLPDYIEHLYQKKFKKEAPDDIRPLEVRDAEKRNRKAAKKKEARSGEAATPSKPA